MRIFWIIYNSRYPENPRLQADWTELLPSVDLEAIAKKPITPGGTLSEPQE
ncbi:MAG: DUF928 domain-containing protein [Kastovskya adunca ATA6-11-RM4]|nr:DUF928 domain-containing protein [Kastovskya adunca ATA6-11-RM4]